MQLIQQRVMLLIMRSISYVGSKNHWSCKGVANMTRFWGGCFKSFKSIPNMRDRIHVLCFSWPLHGLNWFLLKIIIQDAIPVRTNIVFLIQEIITYCRSMMAHRHSWQNKWIIIKHNSHMPNLKLPVLLWIAVAHGIKKESGLS